MTEWVDAHASTVKPKTFAGCRHDIVPRIGRMRLQALRPTVISKLYRDLAEHGRDGRPLSATTVSHVHRTLRKALADAVDVEQLLAANPAARSNYPGAAGVSPSRSGLFSSSARSSTPPGLTGCSPSSASPPTRVPGVANCSTSGGKL